MSVCLCVNRAVRERETQFFTISNSTQLPLTSNKAQTFEGKTITKKALEHKHVKRVVVSMVSLMPLLMPPKVTALLGMTPVTYEIHKEPTSKRQNKNRCDRNIYN